MDGIALLEAMATLSARMVEAAEAQEWAVLTSIHQDLLALQARLMALEPEGHQPAGLTPAEQARKAAHAGRILADQARILALVEPAQDSVRRLLSASAVGRTLRKAYSLPAS